jgi:hypothetical protein
VDEDFQEFEALGGETEKWGKLELANDARAAHRAIKLGDDQRGRTTGAGLGNKWHLGYSNGDSVAGFLIPVNIFDEKSKYLIYIKIYWFRTIRLA